MPITICPRCYHDNPDAPLYCAKCGTDLEAAFQQVENRKLFPMMEGALSTREGGDEQSNQPIHLDAKSIINNRKTIGILIGIIGVGLIIISPSVLFVGPGHPSEWDPLGFDRQITDLRDAAKFCGVALLIVGGIISAVGFSQFTSTQPTTPRAPTTQPVVTQPVSPKSVELGNTPDEVQSVMGQPDKIINLGARSIHVYKDMKIIYVHDKVSDVQLS